MDDEMRHRLDELFAERTPAIFEGIMADAGVAAQLAYLRSYGKPAGMSDADFERGLAEIETRRRDESDRRDS